MKYTKEQLDFFTREGKKGGNIMKKRGAEYFSRISKIGWKKRKHDDNKKK